MILDSMDGWDFDDSNKTDYPVATTNLVAGQQDYLFPTGLLKIKRVEAQLDGATWTRINPFDINMTGSATDTTSITNNFTTASPFYDTEGTALKLYPIPASNVTNGLKIWYVREVAEYTSAEVTTGTKEPGFDEPFHIMIPLGVSWDWFVAKSLNDKAAVIQAELADYELRLRKHYGNKDLDFPKALTPAYVSYD